MPTGIRTHVVTGAVVALAATGALSAAATLPLLAPSPDVVVSQVYGGGGNSGATFTHDYIELFNRGDAAVDVAGWSVQYASASGTTWQVTRLAGTLQAGRHYLVQQAQGSGGTTPLPTPDAVGTIPMSATSGKVALVTTSAPLTCATGCPTAPGVRDFVGYGAANDAETAPAPAPSNTTAALRLADGAQDTDNNATDFAAGTPNPRGSGGVGIPRRIPEIQGAAHRSPAEGQQVTDIPGVVTAVDDRGFWLQDTEPDADPATSEGIFVFTSTAPTVTAGDTLLVDGRVTEFRPGGGGTNNLSTTELTAPVVTVVGRADPPAPTLVGPGGRVAPPAIRSDAPGNVELSPVFDPAANALDFYESLEGMLVRVTDAVAVGPTNDFGELAVLPGGAGGPRTARGGIRYTYVDPNTERMILDDVLASMPPANTGDRLPGAVDGVLDYSFGNFKLLILGPPTVTPNALPRERTRQQRENELAIATYNVENLDPADPAEKFARLAAGIVDNLRSPDIVALEEVQDNTGPVNDGVVAADVTYRTLIDAIAAAGGPRYDFRQIDPADSDDGGEPGGNIRVGFLFRTDRDLTFVDRPGGDATTPTHAVRLGGRAALTLSPGRVDPTNAAFDNSRKPLAGEFRFRGRTVFVVANHFVSKGGDQPLFGRFQPPTRGSEFPRHAQATAVRAFVDEIQAIDRLSGVVVLGDLNDFEFSQTAAIVAGTGLGTLVNLHNMLPEAERYTFIFDGNSQVLDHTLLSLPMLLFGVEYDIVHINAEYTEGAGAASDHEPQITRVRFRPGG